MKAIKKMVSKFLSWGYHEEFSAIAVFLFGFLFVNLYFSKKFPEAGFFNIPSQMETLVYSGMKFFLAIALTWIGFRVMFPDAYRFFRVTIYRGFEQLPFDVKLNWVLKLIMILAFIASVSIARAQDTRTELVQLVRSQVGIHEITENDSPDIKKYLAHVGINKPAPWCVSWVSYDLSAVGVSNPRSAYSPDYARKKDIIWTPKDPRIKPMAGDVITIYYSNLGRVGHGCFYLNTDKSGYFITGEGNANQRLSRTGGEICILKRDPNKIYAISRFIK
jgi:hypothetical protein